MKNDRIKKNAPARSADWPSAASREAAGFTSNRQPEETLKSNQPLTHRQHKH
jgi:hypothetical protein